MPLDPGLMGQAQEQRQDRPDERDDTRPEDREDDTDRAIRLARAHCIEAVEFLIFMMNAQQGSGEDRTRAAQTLLEVAGCL